MAKTKTSNNHNGRGPFDEAMRELIRAQASLVQAQAGLAQAQATQAQNLAIFQAEMAEMRRELADFRRQVGDRFAHVEAILNEHTRTLARLPEEVRERIGFKAPQ